ncbi:MAG: galactokinase [Lacipirellulaceae bacterium]
MTLQIAKSLPDLVGSAERSLRDAWGVASECVTAAPGRVNLIGEHTDYNDGFVLPMAIERQTVVAAARRDDGRPLARIRSVAMGASVELSLEAGGPSPGGWAGYARGVLDAYREHGVAVPAFDAAIDSSVPLGGGLSSSAALEVSLALMVESLAGVTLPARTRALLCQTAEHRGAGVPCGIMDQFSSVLCERDHLMLLDCRSQEPTAVPFLDAAVSVLITNSNVKHELTGGEYAERRAQCEAAANALGVRALRDVTPEELDRRRSSLDPLPLLRARHVVGENRRTLLAADAVAASDWPAVGELMYASHAAMRYDFEITIPEIDTLVEIARAVGPAGGVIGSRMTGGGFGGCTVTLVETERAATVAAMLTERYRQVTRIEATCFTTRAAQGGHVLYTSAT